VVVFGPVVLPRHHVFVCTNARAEGGRPSCGARGSVEVQVALTNEILRRGLGADVAITHSGCLGPCWDGPNVVVYPDGVFYTGVNPEDAPAITDHLAGGEPVARLLRTR
jgi:(2Fe-2S) ferredoxin